MIVTTDIGNGLGARYETIAPAARPEISKAKSEISTGAPREPATDVARPEMGATADVSIRDSAAAENFMQQIKQQLLANPARALAAQAGQLSPQTLPLLA